VWSNSAVLAGAIEYYRSHGESVDLVITDMIMERSQRLGMLQGIEEDKSVRKNGLVERLQFQRGNA